MKLVKIRFTSHYSPYNSGECASFPEDVASRYIKAGVAVLSKGKDDPAEKDLLNGDKL